MGAIIHLHPADAAAPAAANGNTMVLMVGVCLRPSPLPFGVVTPLNGMSLSALFPLCREVVSFESVLSFWRWRHLLN